MRSIQRIGGATLALLALGLASPAVAAAAPVDDTSSTALLDAERIELRPVWPDPRRLVQATAPTVGTLGGLPAPSDLDGPIELVMPEAGPDGFRLEVQLDDVTVYVASDLGGGLRRLDSLDFETYFVVGAELHLGRGVRIFIEDFQPAGMVLGEVDEEEAPPDRYWDGHQIAAGIRIEPAPGVSFEASPILYALSPTDRPSSFGVVASIRVRL